MPKSIPQISPAWQEKNTKRFGQEHLPKNKKIAFAICTNHPKCFRMLKIPAHWPCLTQFVPLKKSYMAAFLSDKRDFQHCGSAFFTQTRYTKQLR